MCFHWTYFLIKDIDAYILLLGVLIYLDMLFDESIFAFAKLTNLSSFKAQIEQLAILSNNY